MTDVKTVVPSLYLREDELRRAVELLYFAYRDFNDEADALLDAHGLGRAHHRALHFIGRRPGITVGGLLGFLKITKQSLSRVLGALVEEGYVRQEVGAEDKRERHLSLTEKGETLYRRLMEVQHERIAAAYRAAGPSAVGGFWAVLTELVDPAERDEIKAFVES